MFIALRLFISNMLTAIYNNLLSLLPPPRLYRVRMCVCVCVCVWMWVGRSFHIPPLPPPIHLAEFITRLVRLEMMVIKHQQQVPYSR